ncbi:flavin reductase [Streptomyces sp. NPDC087300]|uniref:flavin reductase n=1 Tax=Streptomyces sp. NPDC087300 TaxID=3365780 RepID=UPI0037FF146C
MDTVSFAAPLLVLAAILPTALAGRRFARLVGRPPVAGEVVFCTLLGAVLVTCAGWGGDFAPGRELLTQLGQFGLALFLVGTAHEVRGSAFVAPCRTASWLSVAAALLPMAAGAGLAGWVLAYGTPELRGAAPASALILVVTVALSSTAVPVLATALRNRNIQNSPASRLATDRAAFVEAVIWVLLAATLGLAAGDDGPGRTALVLGGGLAAAYVLRRLARTTAVRSFAARFPLGVLLLIAAPAALAVHLRGHVGLAVLCGAVLVGTALPADGRRGSFTLSSRTLAGLGRLTLPVLFTLTGTAAVAASPPALPWTALLLGGTLAVLARLAGSGLAAVACARRGGTPRTRAEALRLTALLNTGGLTELVVLQTGYAAGILTPGVYLALLVMALAATGLSGPLLWTADRRAKAATPAWGRRAAGLATAPGGPAAGPTLLHRSGPTGPGPDPVAPAADAVLTTVDSAARTTLPTTGPDPDRFRSLLAGFPDGIAVVTATGADDGPLGTTCSSLCGVILEPPTLLVRMRLGSATLDAALRSGRFAVNLLHGRGRAAADVIAAGGPDRFDRLSWHRTERGAGPHLTDAARTIADCRITRTVRVGTQRMVFGEVYDITEPAAAEPPSPSGPRHHGPWPGA